MQSATFESSLLRILPENIWGFLLSDDVPLLSKLLSISVPMETLGKINATSTASESDEYTGLLSDSSGRGKMKVINTGTIDPL
jgi:hypothetical protein